MALILINQALALDPTNPYLYGQLGQLYLHLLGEPEKALDYFDQAIALEGAPFWVYGHRGIAHRDLGEYDEALADFSQMIALDPADPWPYLETGWIFLYQLDQPDQALAAFKQAIAVRPEYADGYLGRGRALRVLGHDPAEIIAAWQTCLEVNSDQYWCYWELAWLFVELNQVEPALDNFQLFLDHIPADDCLDCQQEARIYIRDHNR